VFVYFGVVSQHSVLFQTLGGGTQSHKHTQCLKEAISHTYVFGLKYTEGYMRFLKMLQGLGSC